MKITILCSLVFLVAIYVGVCYVYTTIERLLAALLGRVHAMKKLLGTVPKADVFAFEVASTW
jgi:hypothetical protein